MFSNSHSDWCIRSDIGGIKVGVQFKISISSKHRRIPCVPGNVNFCIVKTFGLKIGTEVNKLIIDKNSILVDNTVTLVAYEFFSLL